MDGLSAGELRALLREHLIIMTPGEILVVMVPPDWTPLQVREYNDALRAYCEDSELRLGIRAIAVPGTAVASGRSRTTRSRISKGRGPADGGSGASQSGVSEASREAALRPGPLSRIVSGPAR
jgi:hypothetical protein